MNEDDRKELDGLVASIGLIPVLAELRGISAGRLGYDHPGWGEIAAALNVSERAEASRRVRENLQLGHQPVECWGHGRGGTLECCDLAGVYNGFGSDGPLAFTCPKHCSCHD